MLAESHYQLVTVVKGPSVMRILGAVVEGILVQGGTSPPSRYVHQVRARKGGQVMFEVETTNGLADTEAQRMIQHDLTSLTVAEFEQETALGRWCLPTVGRRRRPPNSSRVTW